MEWSSLSLELLYLEATFGCIKTGSYRPTFISYICLIFEIFELKNVHTCMCLLADEIKCSVICYQVLFSLHSSLLSAMYIFAMKMHQPKSRCLLPSV